MSASKEHSTSDGEEEEHEEGDDADGDVNDNDNPQSKSFMRQVRDFIAKLRPGDDMTHVSLPASFMAPRGMLELFAEATLPRFYTLPYVAKQKDPETRFLGVLRYFVLSVVHMKSGNKPFNPVLGEQYDAFVNLQPDHKLGLKPILERDAGDTGTTPRGFSTDVTEEAERRLKKARKNLRETDGIRASAALRGSVHQMLEQTSHHPPTTASFLHHAESGVRIGRVSSSAVHFLGTSVKVAQNTSTWLSLDRSRSAKDGEESESNTEYYVMTQPPNIMIRILRMQSEYVGTSVFFCPQTGYGAHLKFKEKPTFGGRWHDVSGHVWRVVDVVKGKKSGALEAVPEQLFKISGNWAEGVHLTPCSPDGKKTTGDVKHSWISEDWAWLLFDEDSSHEMSSRHIWGKAIDDLFAGDLTNANKNKAAVEQKQRKDRAEKKHDHYESRRFQEESSPFTKGALSSLVEKAGSVDAFVDSLAAIHKELPDDLRRSCTVPKPSELGKAKASDDHRRIRTLSRDEERV